MDMPFIGSEAVAAGQLTPHLLRTRFVSIYPGVYLPRDAQVSAGTRAEAAWLWSKRRGVLAGFSASAVHGAKWISRGRPAEILHDNRRPPPRLRTWADRIDDDEIDVVHGMRVTSPARTALDLACRYPVDEAVTAVDALARATRLKMLDVQSLSERYSGRRGMKHARRTLDLVDAGAESPRETSLRLLLVRSGFPRPQTQIPVYDEFGQLVCELDMGWRELMVGVQYEGDHHRTNPQQFNKDIRNMEIVSGLGWIVVRITSQDCAPDIVRRVGSARASRM
ncbi:MAG TPA: hypothetical protein VFB19_07235 [Mycobacterium sp.]|nr:hypothetical protein [Mycobacterium sp.]